MSSRSGNTQTAKFIVTDKGKSGSEDPELCVWRIFVKATRDYGDDNRRFFGRDEGAAEIKIETHNKGVADFFQIGRVLYVDFEEAMGT